MATSDQKQALSTPLSITGSAEELDRELPRQLATFTESVVKTGSNLEELRIQHAAAVKAVEAENKKHLDEKKKGSGAKATVASPAPSQTTEFKDGNLTLRWHRRPKYAVSSIYRTRGQDPTRLSQVQCEVRDRDGASTY